MYKLFFGYLFANLELKDQLCYSINSGNFYDIFKTNLNLRNSLVYNIL